MTKIVTKILSIAIIAIGIGFFLNLTIDNPYSHKLARTIINEKLKQWEDIHIEFQALEVSAFPLGATLYGFKVTSSKNTDLVLTEAANVKVKVSFTSILLGTPRLGLIEANELKFKYPLPPELMEIFASKEEPAPIAWPLGFDLPVDKIVLTNAQIEFTIPGEKETDPNIMDLSLGGFNFAFWYDDWNNWEIESDVQAFNLACLGKAFIKQAQVKLAGDFRNKQFNSSDFSVSSENISFHGATVMHLLTRKNDGTKLPARLAKEILSSLSVVATADVSNSNLRALGDFLGVDKTEGQVSGEMELTMDLPIHPDAPAASWGLTGKGAVQDGRIYGFRLYDTQTDLIIDKEKIQFANGVVSKEGQVVADANGVIHFDKALNMEFMAKPRDLALVDLLGAVQVPDFKVLNGSINSENLSVVGQGFPFGLKITTNALVHDMTFPILKIERKPEMRPTCDLDIALDVNTAQLTFERLQGNCFLPEGQNISTVSSLFGAGDIFFDSKKGLNLKINSPNLDIVLTEFLTGLNITGPADIKASISGPYSDIITTADVRASKLSMFGIPTKLSSHVSVSAKKAEARIEQTEIKFDGDGTLSSPETVIKFAEGVPFETTLEGYNIDNALFREIITLFGSPHEVEFGAKRLKGKMNGHLMSPLASAGNLKAILTNGTFDKEPIFDFFEFDLESDQNSVHTENLYYEKKSIKINGGLTITKQKKFSYAEAQAANDLLVRLGLHTNDKVDFHANFLQGSDQEDHLKNIPFLGKYIEKSQTEAQIAADVKLGGTMDRLEGKFEGEFKDVNLLKSNIPPIKFSGFVDGGKINVPIIVQAGNSLEGRIQFDIASKGIPYNWYFKLHNFDMRAFATKVVSEDPRNFAYLNSAWEMQGEFSDWWRSKGKLTIEKFSSKIVRTSPDRSSVFDLDLKNSVTVLMDNGKWSFADGGDFTFVSRASEVKILLKESTFPNQVNVEFAGTIDIQLLQSLAPQIYAAKGKLEIEGSMTGSIFSPDFSLHIKDSKPSSFSHADWEPLTISFVDFNPPLSNIQMDISYVDSKWTIQQFRASKGTNGTIEVSGQMDLKSANPNDSKILISLNKAEFQRLPFFVLKSVNTTIDADIALVGNKFPLKASGSLGIVQADSQGSFDIRQQIVDAIRKQKIKSNTTAKQSYLVFDIHLSSNNSVNVASKNLSATLGGDLHLTGTEVSPVLVGQVSIPQGRFTYKRDFEILSGNIFFDEPITPPDPKLDITGEARVSKYTVQFIVTGYASQPKVDFAVEPATRPDGTPITKLEILVLLSSGTLPNPDQSVGLSQSVAYNEALSIVIGQFEEPIEKLMELSGQSVIRQVYLDTYTSGSTNSPVARLNLPINLSDDVNLIFQVDSESNMKISSEYSLHDSISISGGVDKKKEDEVQNEDSSLVGTDTGVDLRFRFNFP
ncbi:MAG: translocation/assembly module TamB domain-containing protein [Oligoflexales bacterium]